MRIIGNRLNVGEQGEDPIQLPDYIVNLYAVSTLCLLMLTTRSIKYCRRDEVASINCPMVRCDNCAVLICPVMSPDERHHELMLRLGLTVQAMKALM